MQDITQDVNENYRREVEEQHRELVLFALLLELIDEYGVRGPNGRGGYPGSYGVYGDMVVGAVLDPSVEYRRACLEEWTLDMCGTDIEELGDVDFEEWISSRQSLSAEFLAWFKEKVAEYRA